jgi:NAD(P)-dependent dehydrogenase (short-subunit alcohol dehydrogenase family)
VITGAGGGIGGALARRAAAEGANVAATDLTADSLQALEDELGDGHLFLPADVTDPQQVTELLAHVASELGPVDVFFANAGVAVGGDPIETPDEIWEQALGVNLRAHVFAARALLPGWLERGEGYFVSTASAAGLLTQIGSAPYAVTKHGAVAFAEWLSITYGHRGVRVSCICPQGVNTAMLQVAAPGSPGQVAADVVRAGGEVLEPDDVAVATMEAIDQERFLVLPHPEVLTYFQRKAGDYERWLEGMRRLQERVEAMAAKRP